MERGGLVWGRVLKKWRIARRSIPTFVGFVGPELKVPSLSSGPVEHPRDSAIVGREGRLCGREATEAVEPRSRAGAKIRSPHASSVPIYSHPRLLPLLRCLRFLLLKNQPLWRRPVWKKWEPDGAGCLGYASPFRLSSTGYLRQCLRFPTLS
jgi:hypothetical protein